MNTTKDLDIASTLRSYREAMEAISIEKELQQQAKDLLFSIKLSIKAISTNGFPRDRRKEVSIILKQTAESIQKLRAMLND